MKRFAWITALIVLASAGARAQDPVFSGPQPGEKATTFKVLSVVGDDAGKEKEIAPAEKPTALVFLHGIERSIVPLVRFLDQYGVERAEKIRVVFVALAADRVQAQERLPLVLRSLRLRMPLTLSPDGPEGPGNYGLNRKCLITVVAVRDGKVSGNLALVQPGIADAPKVLEVLTKAAADDAPPTVEGIQERARPAGAARPPAPAPPTERPVPLETTEDLKAAIRALQAQVAALRRELDALRGANPAPRGAQPAPPAGRELPGAAPTDPKLVSMLRAFIQPTNDDATVDRVLSEVDAYIKGDADRTRQAVGGWTRVLFLKYGTAYAQKAGQAFVERIRTRP